MLGIELDPIAALMARANLAAAGMAGRASIVRSDYRARPAEPGDGPTLYVGNPPYVRHHQIGPEWKEWLAAEAAKRGLVASRLAGLHVHFFLATAMRSVPGDRGVFITSAEWLDVNYGRLVRELLLDGLGGEAIHIVAPEARPFEDAQTTAAITCFQIGARPSSVRLRKVKSIGKLGPLDGGQPVRRERLREAPRWTPLLRTARKVPPGHVELGELFRVHRGAVTGANRVWVVDVDSVDLPEGVVFRAITRARELFEAGVELKAAGSLRGVVDLPHDLDEFDAGDRKAVERFLRGARREGAHQGYIAQARRSWWSVGLREPAPILATYMARRPPAFVRNRVEARHINIAHGIYPRGSLSERALRMVAAALRKSVTLGDGRTYAGGLTKFEPREMERLLVPDVTAPAT